MMLDDPQKESIRRLADAAMDVHAKVNLFRAFELVESAEMKIHSAHAYRELVRRFYFEHRNLPAMVMTGTAAIRFCLAEARRHIMTNAEDEREMLDAAKVIAYNAAANVWPGWNDEGISPERASIGAGLEMARLSMDLVQELGLGSNQLGNGRWLMGALLLALGERTKAKEAFMRAAAEFSKAENRAGKLMADGYAALTTLLTEPADHEAAARYEVSLRLLREEGSEDSVGYAGQIETAKIVFGRPAAKI